MESWLASPLLKRTRAWIKRHGQDALPPPLPVLAWRCKLARYETANDPKRERSVMSTAPLSKNEPDDAPKAARWVLLVTTLAVDDAQGRMKVLRTLETLGAAVLREGVYLLPETRENRRGMQRLAEHINRATGTAHLLHAATLDEEQTRQFRGRFDREARYAELIKTVEGMQVAFGVSDPTAIAKVLAKLRRDFEAVRGLDFFPSPLIDRTERVMAESEEAVRKLMFPDEGEAPAAGSGAPRGRRLYFRRAWATRKPLYVDRLASAWLIRRFIDPEAIMIWLEKNTPCPRTAVGFGFDGAEFRNTRDRVTYQQLLSQFNLTSNPALVKLGVLMHALDAGDAQVPEAAGVETLLAGARRRADSDDELLAESEKTFDLLYDAYFEMPPGKG